MKQFKILLFPVCVVLLLSSCDFLTTLFYGRLIPPAGPSPVDQATVAADADSTITITWTDSWNGGTITYDIYFGTTLPMAPSSRDLTVPTWKTTKLSPETTYKWYVTAKSPGQADAPSPTWTFSTVAGTTHVPVTGVSLSQSALTMSVGSSHAISATVTPSNATDKSVTWRSSDTSVSVDSTGLVTATGLGSATITATSTDGGYMATCSVTVPPTYADFPADLRSKLDSLNFLIGANGGFAIAGKVQLSDHAVITGGEDAMVNFQSGYMIGIDAPTMMYPGGWFMTDAPLDAFYTGSGRYLFARAFGYQSLDVPINAPNGEIAYFYLRLDKTPADLLTSVNGIVRDQNDQPLSGATIRLSFPFSYYATNGAPFHTFLTLSDGRYNFDGLSATQYILTAESTGFAFSYAQVVPAAGTPLLQNLRLFPNRTIVIDYVYQPNGSRSFSSNPQVGTLSWTSQSGGLDFSSGSIVWTQSRDLELTQNQDLLSFRNFYVDGQNGFYDAGPVSLVSVTDAAVTGYITDNISCQLGHVYVVKTLYDHCYAKFIVNAISDSLSTVVTPISLSDFSGNEAIETFDPNFGRQDSPVAFHGVTYTSLSGTQLWSDINWTNNGFYADLPTASGSFALNDTVGLTNLQIDFSSPVQRVGILAATSLVTTFIMTAYDDNLVSIGAIAATMPRESRAVFLGLEATSNIRRVCITEPFDNGQVSIFDDLRYEPLH